MVLGYQTGGHSHTGTLPAVPKDRWRNFFIGDIDHVDTPALVLGGRAALSRLLDQTLPSSSQRRRSPHSAI